MDPLWDSTTIGVYAYCFKLVLEYVTEGEDPWASTFKYSSLPSTLTFNLFQQGSCFSERRVNLPLLPTRLFALYPRALSPHFTFLYQRDSFSVYFSSSSPDRSCQVSPFFLLSFVKLAILSKFLLSCPLTLPVLHFTAQKTHPLITSVSFSWHSVPLHFSYRHTSLGQLT